MSDETIKSAFGGIAQEGGSEPARFGRRLFLRDSVALPPLIGALFAASVTLSCDDSSSSSGNDDDVDGLEGAISANHGHSCVITQAELDAEEAVVLTLTEGSSHTHTLALMAQQVMDIAAGTVVTETSSDAGHTHDVTFN